MRKKEKTLLTERMTYIQTLMSKDERIKKEIENGFKLFLEDNKIPSFKKEIT